MEIRLKSRRLAPDSFAWMSDLFGIKALLAKHEFVESYGDVNDSNDPEKLPIDLKTQILKVSESYCEVHLKRPLVF